MLALITRVSGGWLTQFGIRKLNVLVAYSYNKHDDDVYIGAVIKWS